MSDTHRQKLWQDRNKMTRRNSPNAIKTLDDLSALSSIVVDKRLGKRSSAKKSRRNRHYEKQFIRNTLAHHLTKEDSEQQSDV